MNKEMIQSHREQIQYYESELLKLNARLKDVSFNRTTECLKSNISVNHFIKIRDYYGGIMASIEVDIIECKQQIKAYEDDITKLEKEN
jgi:hypothetical protein